MGERIPLILDTDIGSDIDDAVCLSYLLREPRCELLGVTTVTGDVAKRAALCEVICRAAGREDVPIHAGAGPALLGGPGQPDVPQYEAIADRPHRRDWAPNTAIEFLRQTIRSRPGEITLLTIGPLTNAGLLFSVDPEIPGLLRELVMMCGVFTAGKGGFGPGAREWNALCDPLATAMVYQARPPRCTSIGLEVTTQCVLPADECRQRFRAIGGPLGIVADMAEVWFRGCPGITFHDPLAAVATFTPDVCTYAQGTVGVHLGDPSLAGLTRFVPDENGPHRVAVDVDAGRFFELYFA